MFFNDNPTTLLGISNLDNVNGEIDPKIRLERYVREKMRLLSFESNCHKIA